MKFCINDKDVKDDKDNKYYNNVDNDNDDYDDEYNDVNEHIVKLYSDKTEQSTEVHDNKPTFEALSAH